MTFLEDLLIEKLKSFGFPVKRQGSLAENEPYPDSFFTFWNVEAFGDSFYDNLEHRTNWQFDVNFYSTDPALVYTMLLEAKTVLLAAGFTVSGKGYDVTSDEITHTGRGIEVFYLENE